jgi:hypothetical protein
MSLTIADETLIELVRGEVARQVAELRPVIRAELVESFKWVTEATGVELLEIGGKDPERTFRRLMNTHGVEVCKLLGSSHEKVRYRWKRREPKPAGAGMSIEELIDANVVKASSKRPQLRAAA